MVCKPKKNDLSMHRFIVTWYKDLSHIVGLGLWLPRASTFDNWGKWNKAQSDLR